MNEYDALIESCRACASRFNTNCDRCMFCRKDNLKKFCYEQLHAAAADAIEELSNAGSIYGKAWTLGYDAGRDENSPRWIPVTERLPETDGLYLVSVKNDHKRRYSKTAWYEKQSWFAWQDVTHWMRLPEPPKEET